MKKILLLVRVFAKLNQSSGRSLWVNESDVQAFGTFARSLVDEATAFAFNFGKSVCNAIFNSKSNVLNAAATAVVGNELGNCAVFGSCFKKLDFCLANFEECSAHFLVGNFLNCKALEA